MTNKFKKVENISYGNRIKNSFMGVIVGLMLFLTSIFFTCVNEASYIDNIKKINLMKENAIEISSSKIDRSNDNKLISTNGSVYSDETLQDEFIKIDNALALKRTVEMYQWRERKYTHENRNNGISSKSITKYYYDKIWTDRELNSNDYNDKSYKNPKFSVHNKIISVNKAFMGDFELIPEQLLEMTSFSSVTISDPKINYMIYNNSYYKGKNPTNPQIGDIRISYSYVPTGTPLSIIGQQKRDNTIGKDFDKKIDVYAQYDGSLTLNEMLSRLKNENITNTNSFRLWSFLMMFIGLNLLVNPIKIIVGYIPFLETFVEYISIFALFLISIALTLIIIAIIWLFYKPLFSSSIIAIIVFTVIWYKKHIKQNNQETHSSVQLQ